MWHIARLARHFKHLLGIMLLGLAAGGALAADEENSPPERVARLNYLTGKASFSAAGTQDWVAASLNRPLTAGDRLWVEEGGRAELHVGATALRLAGSTAMEVIDLGDEDLAVKITQGSFTIRVRELEDDDAIEIATPNLSFSVRENGEYRFDVDADRNMTTVSVRRGGGTAYGSDASRQRMRLDAGQRLRVDGQDLFPLENGGVAPRDEFERWAAARDAREDAAESARYVSRSMTGYEDLDANGDWREVEGYGAVWTPRVRIANWAPYQYGRWEWIAPWGWTWIDDAPWGFAPFHYGRWAWLDSRWCWVPGPRVRRAVYAPALVAFVGSSHSNVRVGVSLSIGLPGVAWFALGPNEPYQPAYTRNRRYVERVNVHVSVRGDRPVQYVNQRVPHAVAVMPAEDFARGRPHRADDRRWGQHDFSRMPVAQGRPVDAPREEWRRSPERVTVAPPSRVFEPPVVRPMRDAAARREDRNDRDSRRDERRDDRRDGRPDARAPERAEPRFEQRVEQRDNPVMRDMRRQRDVDAGNRPARDAMPDNRERNAPVFGGRRDGNATPPQSGEDRVPRMRQPEIVPNDDSAQRERERAERERERDQNRERDRDRDRERDRERDFRRQRDGNAGEVRAPATAPIAPPAAPAMPERTPEKPQFERRLPSIATPTPPVEDRVPRMQQPQIRNDPVPAPAARPAPQEPPRQEGGMRPMRNDNERRPDRPEGGRGR
ncbi:DUF6600 domain-containing protein [Viridibacterium curvum]|uniref:FecR protein domain-containing protein n=1 Tax=Viridibacterium curvum TaxID=1101404 RepID=A0ABP9QRJ1_9RHOO